MRTTRHTTTPRRTILISLIIATALVLGACAEAEPLASAEPATSTPLVAAPSVAATAAVVIDTFAFVPASLEVRVGTTVTWTNGDRIDHTVTSGEPDAPDGLFDGLLPDKGTTFSWTFDEPGVYAYFCGIHPHMRGQITVTP